MPDRCPNYPIPCWKYPRCGHVNDVPKGSTGEVDRCVDLDPDNVILSLRPDGTVKNLNTGEHFDSLRAAATRLEAKP